VRYRLQIEEQAFGQLRALPPAERRAAGRRIRLLQEDLQGNVKKLTAGGSKYRMCVGRLRVLFVLEKDLITVYAVEARKDAYKKR
jgi:mRNA-degrading endonuclease RelE of RelBE toxin-antitoxin system